MLIDKIKKINNSEYAPLILVLLILIISLLFVNSIKIWLTLTIAGISMGMIIFTMTAGLMLVFGLMDVLNFANAAFVTLGAYIGIKTLSFFSALTTSNYVFANIFVIIIALMAIVIIVGIVGWVFEKIIIQPVYGSHIKQILVTIGGMIVIEQIIYVIFGASEVSVAVPVFLMGTIDIFDGILIEKYRVYAAIFGVFVALFIYFLLEKTKIGLLVRAGVENREMVEILGHKISQLFLFVFIFACILTSIGGLMLALYRDTINPHLGQTSAVLIFTVVVMSGLGSNKGCFIASLMVGIIYNYFSYLLPELAEFSSILLMLVILLWRPRGLVAIDYK